MSYAVYDDLVARFGVVEIEQLKSMHDDGMVSCQKALVDASDEINSYLAVRYAVPVPSSEFLTIVACNIARYRLYINDAEGEVRKRYEEAILWLKDVANGKAKLTHVHGDDEPITPKPPPNAPIGGNHKGRVFGDEIFDKLPFG